MRPARAIIPVAPTALTLGNLVCGFLAMAKTVDAMATSSGAGAFDPAFTTKILEASWFVVLAMVFDALDGRIARLTNQASAFGSQLDSLADVVTFGVTPALMAKVVYEHGKIALHQPFFPKIVTALCAIYLIGAVLRLARFTVSTDTDEGSHHTFQGLPSPAAAGVVVSACIFIFDGRDELGLSKPWAEGLAVTILRALPLMACCLGLLMVSRVPYVHLVQRYVGHSTRVATFVKLVVVVALVLIFHEWSLFLAVLLYVVGGLALAGRARLTGRSPIEQLPDPWDEDVDESWSEPRSRAGNGHKEPRT